ncbi:MAG: hypothetical protein H6918_04165 [Sphingomonadaceae bacterium]|nr:hypothetical protein [Sphingomonadaceae bacterium]
MKRLPALPLIALALAAPVSAQQSVRDFQLPPSPTPSATPNVQGPVDTEGAVPVAPRAIETDRPAPTPSPLPSATPAPAPTPSTAPTQSQPRPTAEPQRQSAPVQPPAPSASPAPDGVEAIPASPPELPAAPEAMSVQEGPATETPNAEMPWWIWLAGAVGGLVVLILGMWAWRRRREEPVEEIVPPIVQTEPAPVATPLAPAAPVTAPEIQPAPTPRPAPALARSIAIRAPLLEMETATLSRSVMALRLSYHLRVTNPGGTALEGLQLEGELAAAHGSAPIDAQRADPARALTLRNELPRLDPGETQVLKGEIVLPLSEIRPIMQGNVPLLVPLLLWRCTGNGFLPSARTYLLGEVPETIGSRLRPYRLDLPPQGYPNLGLKALD